MRTLSDAIDEVANSGELLRDAELVDGDNAFTSICADCTELLKLLVQMHRAFLWYNPTFPLRFSKKAI